MGELSMEGDFLAMAGPGDTDSLLFYWMSKMGQGRAINT